MKKKYLSWRQTEALVKKLANLVREDFEPDVVIGIARGGLVVAVMLSHLLGCEFRVVHIRHYAGKRRLSRPKLISAPGDLNGRVLIVDDVADTGVTLRFAKSFLSGRGVKNVKTAALAYKPRSKLVPDYFLFKTSDWIVFPWELSRKS